jgi:hypothetical protein
MLTDLDFGGRDLRLAGEMSGEAQGECLDRID